MLLCFRQLTVAAAFEHPAHQQQDNPREAHVQGNTGVRVVANQANDKHQEDQPDDGRRNAARYFELQRW